MKILTATHLLPVSGPPIERGAVAVDGSEIAGVGNREDIIGQFPTANVQDFGDAAILPGFVNCHSHLEITSMRGGLDDVEHDFSAWLIKLNDLRTGITDDGIRAAAIAGATEGAQAGVTCFGDIGRFGAAGLEALKAVGLRGVLFQETEFSPDDRTAENDFNALIGKFGHLRSSATDLVEVGLSPHSPYTVGPKLFKLIADFAAKEKVKLTIHTAESTDEHEFLMSGTGFFAGIFKKYGFEWSAPHCSPVEYLDRLGVLNARPLLAHCVTVSASDIGLIADSGSTIAHCPKSNAKFGHGYAPFEAFLNSGIGVGLGSDSVASNNVCDLLEESRFASLTARNRVGSRRFITAEEMLRAATLGGATALGLKDKVGTLETGKQADITVVSLTQAAQQPVNDIHTALVFASNARDVVMTMVAGNAVYCRE